ncbi:MAG: hypothetical protein LCI00_21205 [Chloroflexi bacterium]|nr:hypothetical protein [Chloroflexota bacterium]MCC6892372.1 hypothetical protein [Anaerolineae bacterium]
MTHHIQLTRRRFLQLLGSAALLPLQQPPTGPNDWTQETDLARSIREFLEESFSGWEMALDFRRINANNNQEFIIQIQSDKLYPVASCFKAWIALYYYFYTPRDQWQDTQGTPLYSTIVFSNNTEAGTTLAEVANRVPGAGNPIEKFNDFLRTRVGMTNGMYSWNWTGSGTAGFTDERFVPSDNRGMTYNGEFYRVDNLFNVTDLAHGYDVLQRGQSFARWSTMYDAIMATDALLSIRASDYTSPLEYVFPEGYMGKDGILPATDLPPGLGRVIADAGVITVGDAHYIIAFMSMGVGESIVRNKLDDLARMIEVYERGRPSITPPPYDDGNRDN